MAYVAGIDLGTTSTVAAVVRHGVASVVQLGATDTVIPSSVAVGADGTLVAGEAAEQHALVDPARTVREFKRRLGDAVPYLIGGTPLTAEQFAGEMYSAVLNTMGLSYGERPARIVLTHPASYGPHKLDAVRAAAARAGIDPVLVAEPVAAAIAYLDTHNLPVGAYMAVYDFGGGTFDAAVVRRDADGPTLMSSRGLERAGGADLDDALSRFVISSSGRDHDAAGELDGPAASRLRNEVRAAKEALSSNTTVDVAVSGLSETASLRVTRPEFESLASGLIAQTIDTLEAAVRAAGVTWADVHTVLAVGGSSRIPAVTEQLRSRTGRPVAVSPDATTSIALGAALMAARLGPTAPTESSVRSTDSTPAPAAGPSPERHRSGPFQRVPKLLLAGLALVLAVALGAWALGNRGGQAEQAAPPTDMSTSGDEPTVPIVAPASTANSVATTTAPVSTATTSPVTTSTTTRATTTRATTSTTRATTTTTRATSTTAPVLAVSSIEATTQWSCEQATAAGNLGPVSWSAPGAATVNLLLDNFGLYASDLPATGSLEIPLPCDDTQTVTIEPIGTDGQPGQRSTIVITIAA